MVLLVLLVPEIVSAVALIQIGHTQTVVVFVEVALGLALIHRSCWRLLRELQWLTRAMRCRHSVIWL